jgi:hypothetical protein
MATLVKGKNIDTSKVSFSAPRVLDNGAKLVYLNYNGGRLSVQTPWMSMPWKMGVYTEGEYPKYSVDLSFKNMDEEPELQAFHDKFLELEEKIIDGGFENSVAWFKKKPASRDVVDALFNRTIKVSTDRETGEPNGKWPPTMKAKVPRRDGTWETKVHDKDGKVYQVNDSDSGDNMEDILVQNTQMRAIIQCVGLWIASGNYMCQWKLTKAEIAVPESSGQHEFLEDSDDDGEAPSNFIESDDDDTTDDDAVPAAAEPAAEVPVKTPKKIVRKVVRKAKE